MVKSELNTNKNRNQELGSGRCGVMAERKKRRE
jgi:hypothetical protein